MGGEGGGLDRDLDLGLVMPPVVGVLMVCCKGVVGCESERVHAITDGLPLPCKAHVPAFKTHPVGTPPTHDKSQSWAGNTYKCAGHV